MSINTGGPQRFIIEAGSKTQSRCSHRAKNQNQNQAPSLIVLLSYRNEDGTKLRVDSVVRLNFY